MSTTLTEGFEALTEQIREQRAQRRASMQATKAYAESVRAEARATRERMQEDFRAMARASHEALDAAAQQCKQAECERRENASRESIERATLIAQESATQRAARLQDYNEFMEYCEQERASRVEHLSQAAHAVEEFLDESREHRLEVQRELLAQLDAETSARREAWEMEHSAIQQDMARARSLWFGLACCSQPEMKPVHRPAEHRVPEQRPVEVVSQESDASEHALVQRIQAFINSQPGGVSVAEMESALDIPRARAGQVCRHLVDQGVIIREAKLYFPPR